MNWIIYATLTLIKLAIIVGLVLLSILTVPVIILMLCLGMSLGYLRDIEPTVYIEKSSFFALENIRSIYFFVITQMVSRLQQISNIRNKSSF